MSATFDLCARVWLAGFFALWLATAAPAAAQAVSPSATAPAVASASDTNAPARLDPGQSAGRKSTTPAWVEKLAASYPILTRQYLGNELWKYLASLIYIFLAFYLSKLLDYLARAWLKHWTERTKTKFDDLLLDLLRGPIKVVLFVIFLHIGLAVFDWPEAIASALSKGLKIVVAASITYMLLKFIDLLMGYWKKRTAEEEQKLFDEQLFPIMRKTFKVFIVVVAALVTSQNLGFDITAVITSLGIGGLAMALAAQDTLSNLFGGAAIFIDKPFRVGDRIQLDSVDGVVESIGLRSTRVRNLDGHLITVPNKTMGNATITNITRRPNIRTLMNISVTYDTPAEKVRRAVDILTEVYRSHPMTFDVWISFNKFADASLNIFVIHWWNGTVYKDYLAGMQELNLTIKTRFDSEKISFAFPTQTLYVKQDSDWRIQGESANVRGLFEQQKPQADQD